MSKRRDFIAKRMIAARNLLAPNGPDELKAWDFEVLPDFVSNLMSRAFRLDPEDRGDRDRLLVLFCIALYGRGDAGRPSSKKNFNQLIYDVEAARNGRKKSDREICRILIEDNHSKFDGRYREAKPDALRHRLRECVS